MTKSELIARLAEKNPHLYQRDVERIVTTIFDEIAEALARGGSGGIARLRRFFGEKPRRPPGPQSAYRRAGSG